MDKFKWILKESHYDDKETQFLLDGFTNDFDIGYCGKRARQSRSKNIPFTVGNNLVLWDKIMNEVKEGRYAGPFDEIPYKNFIQSPIGLVPKAGNKTRLIFHLSYEFKDVSRYLIISRVVVELNLWTHRQSMKTLHGCNFNYHLFRIEAFIQKKKP